MAKSRYTKNDLTRAASEVKRQLLKKVRKGEQIKVTKSEAFDHIAKLLKLKSARTLWQGDTFTYLDNWYSKMESEITTIIDSNSSLNSDTSISDTDNSTTNTDILNQLRKKDTLISEYEKAIKTLRLENESLRLRLIEKHGKIDI